MLAAALHAAACNGPDIQQRGPFGIYMASLSEHVLLLLAAYWGAAAVQHLTVDKIEKEISDAFVNRKIKPKGDKGTSLGSGAYGQVVRVANLRGGEMALKKYQVEQADINAMARKPAVTGVMEVACAVLQLLFQVPMPNVVTYTDLCISFKSSLSAIKVRLGCQLMSGDSTTFRTSLHSLKATVDLGGNPLRVTRVSVQQVYRHAWQGINGLVTLHGMNAVHSDVKPPNYLYQEQPGTDDCDFVTADLGAATLGCRNPGQSLTSYCATLGTQYYMASPRRNRWNSGNDAESARCTEHDDCQSWAMVVIQLVVGCSTGPSLDAYALDLPLQHAIWQGHEPLCLSPSSLDRLQLLLGLRSQKPAGEAMYQILRTAAHALIDEHVTAEQLLVELVTTVQPLIDQAALLTSKKAKCVELQLKDFPPAASANRIFYVPQPAAAAPAPVPATHSHTVSTIPMTSDTVTSHSTGSHLGTDNGTASHASTQPAVQSGAHTSAGNNTAADAMAAASTGVSAPSCHDDIVVSSEAVEEQLSKALADFMVAQASPRQLAASDPGGAPTHPARMPAVASISFAGCAANIPPGAADQLTAADCQGCCADMYVTACDASLASNCNEIEALVQPGAGSLITCTQAIDAHSAVPPISSLPGAIDQGLLQPPVCPPTQAMSSGRLSSNQQQPPVKSRMSSQDASDTVTNDGAAGADVPQQKQAATWWSRCVSWWHKISPPTPAFASAAAVPSSCSDSWSEMQQAWDSRWAGCW